MSTQGEIPIGNPMRDAWERYKLTDEYANTKRWAIHPEHVDGSLWAAFVEGYGTLTAELAAARLQLSAIRWRKVSDDPPTGERRSVLGFYPSNTHVVAGPVDRVLVWPSKSERMWAGYDPTHWREIGPLPSDTEPGTP